MLWQDHENKNVHTLVALSNFNSRLRRIVVVAFCVGLDHWPSLKDIHAPPVVAVPGRHVTIVFQDRTFDGMDIFALNAFQWLERLAATATQGM